MTKETIDIHWLDPVRLAIDDEVEGPVSRQLQRQMRAGYRDQGVSEEQMERSVYIVRLTGSFVLQYPRCNSPVLYIGRGDAPSRLARHVPNWLVNVFYFGSDTEVEVRMLRPRRRGRADYYKNVEADLLKMFSKRTGSLPMFNKCRETKFEDCIDYGSSQQRRLNQQIGVGSGKRPHWAITPTRANPNYDTYHTGHVK